VSTLRAEGLVRTYRGREPVEALRSVSIEAGDGDLVAVLGPSGCGKTTLLRTLAGMEHPDAGTILLGDRVLDGPGAHVAPERRAIGLVPQEGALFPHLDVGGNIAFGLRRLSRAERRARVATMLDLVDLPGYERRRPHELSGGQQQRVALACALAPSPEVVLLDEPFSALDTGLRAALRSQVLATLKEAGTTSLLVTHDQTEALTMADTVAVMREGRIVQAGPPHEVYRRPADAWAAAFLGDAVLLPGRRLGPSSVECALGTLRLAPDFAHHDGEEVTVFCRPEQVQPAAAASEDRSATVCGVRFTGPEVLVELDLHAGGTRLSARWPSTLLPTVGDTPCVAVTGDVLAYPPG